jgi:hypothetical protein
MGDTFTGWAGPGPESGLNITVGPDALNYEGAIYEDSIFSAIPIVGPIIDWLEAQFTVLYNWLLSIFTFIINGIINGVRNIFNAVLTSLSTAVSWIQTKLLDAWYWVSSKIPAAIETIRTQVVNISSWVTSAIPNALTLLRSTLSSVWTWISTEASNALNWLKAQVGSLVTNLAKIPGLLLSAADNIIKTISRALTAMFDPICAGFNAIFKSVGPDIKVALEHNSQAVKDIVLSWQPKGTPVWDWIKYTVKFVLFTPFMNWDIIHQENLSGEERLKAFMNSDISDPILDAIKTLFEKLAGILKAAFDLIWKGLTEFFTVILPGVFRTLWDGLHTAVSWVWDKVAGVADFFLDEVVKLVGIHSPITPEGGMGTLKGMVKVGLALAGGLGVMTVLGNLVHPLHSLGLEHVSAMVYDMTNYRVLIGAGMGVIAACAIRIPLTHYFNDILRPNLPSERDVSEMLNRELINRATFNKFLAYRGYPDQWHEPLARITETPVRYFTLAAIAKAGFYDQVFFEAQLVRGGYDPDTRAALMRMFQTTYSEVIKGLMSGTAIKRFKEGMSTESQFLSELKILGYTDQQFPQYVAAAKLDYAYDYLSDMIAAYKDAAAKGQISLDDFRGALRGLGIVPDRIEAYVLRLRARLDPAGPLKPIGPPKPEYQTEAGQVKVDTLRRHRQKELITRDQEIAGLQKLGAPVDYATSIADNDDVRLAAAAVTEVGPPKPLYETDAGKITVDTIRRQRRKDLITRDEEIAGLMELEMTELYATAIADNDDARLAEKGGGE